MGGTYSVSDYLVELEEVEQKLTLGLREVKRLAINLDRHLRLGPDANDAVKERAIRTVEEISGWAMTALKIERALNARLTNLPKDKTTLFLIRRHDRYMRSAKALQEQCIKVPREILERAKEMRGYQVSGKLSKRMRELHAEIEEKRRD